MKGGEANGIKPGWNVAGQVRNVPARDIGPSSPTRADYSRAA
jgi:hypothetical protein